MKTEDVSASDTATSRRNRGLLAAAVLLEIGWIALLLFLAVVR